MIVRGNRSRCGTFGYNYSLRKIVHSSHDAAAIGLVGDVEVDHKTDVKARDLQIRDQLRRVDRAGARDGFDFDHHGVLRIKSLVDLDRAAKDCVASTRSVVVLPDACRSTMQATAPPEFSEFSACLASPVSCLPNKYEKVDRCVLRVLCGFYHAANRGLIGRWRSTRC